MEKKRQKDGKEEDEADKTHKKSITATRLIEKRWRRHVKKMENKEEGTHRREPSQLPDFSKKLLI